VGGVGGHFLRKLRRHESNTINLILLRFQSQIELRYVRKQDLRETRCLPVRGALNRRIISVRCASRKMIVDRQINRTFTLFYEATIGCSFT
jgi:hypothetical protein